ncbi:MAG: hypothetical protein SOZ28_07310 [Clostridia bacterium]|nr:hypothetical protein [Clostridia bacterium]
MKKKLISIIAAGILGVQALAVPMMASAEESKAYVNKSDFNDVSIGGAKGTGYHGLGIIIDGSPWLSKGSASVHYQTFSYDEQRKVNYCNFWTNSDKTGSGDGAGSMYFYNRNLSAVNQMGPYGLVEYDIRIKPDSQDFNFMMGWFEDPTSSGFNAATDVALTIRFGPNGVTANNGIRTANLATLATDKWYKVRVTIDNNLEEYNAVITDIDTGKTVGSLEAAAYSSSKPAALTGIKTTCWGYIRNNTYNFDMTNVTIARSDTKFSMN